MLLMGLLISLGGAVPEAHHLRVERTPLAAGVRLRLVPSHGVRINARLSPVLELPDGELIRFAATERTSDSAYYLTPPEAIAPAPAIGIIRASICPAGEGLCRVVVVKSEE
jgi:hypothetical protein